MTDTFDEATIVPDCEPAVSTLVLFGRTPARVASMAGVMAEWMTGEGAGVRLSDVAHTLNHHRAWHPFFATVCARDCAQAVAGLAALATGRPAQGVVGPHDGPCAPGTVFVYSGQGSQWAGMGRQLLADEPEFAAAVTELEPVFVEEVGFSLQQVLAAGGPVVGEARVQPVLMGLQLALTELWRAYGTIPDTVVGHSMGEVTAAVVAGALSVAEGLRMIAIRSRLMARLAGRGTMASLELDAARTARLIGDYPGVAVAGISSPRQTVVAGPPAQVDAVITAVRRRNRFARRLNVEVASHSPLMDPIVPELRAALAGLKPGKLAVPFISTVSDTACTPVLDAEYWVANLRQPVQFSSAIAAAAKNNATFIEISPHPMLTHAITETLGEAHHHSVGTLWHDGDDTLRFHTNVNATHGVYPPETPHPPEPHPVLPTMPLQHTRFWISTAGARRSGQSVQSGADARRTGQSLQLISVRRSKG
ncbi:MAG: hypothetical protein JWP83_2532 [Mycobacterium sp.]|jgi:phthiocerol/phenolphthiocerol synthesis type-I polyketide synthase B|nr:hypothetical protein [Mycobacterium sp.]